ncbi:MAG: glycerol-3-phosphate acyltransferase [Coriobacteriaceae bacterium]
MRRQATLAFAGRTLGPSSALAQVQGGIAVAPPASCSSSAPGLPHQIAVFALSIAVTRCVSVGSIAAAVICPVLALYFYWGQWVPWLIIAATACVVIWAHRANIARLRAGTENKIGSKKTA